VSLVMSGIIAGVKPCSASGTPYAVRCGYGLVSDDKDRAVERTLFHLNPRTLPAKNGPTDLRFGSERLGASRWDGNTPYAP
jgi:hypothetical protein